MIKKVTAAAAFAALAAYSGGASAADLGKGAREEPYYAPVTSNPILDVNNQLAVHFVGVNFDYLETGDAGEKLDAETGWVPGLGGSISFMGKFILPNFYAYGSLAHYTGKTDYTGALCSLNGGCGTYGSYKGESGAEVLDWDFRFGHGFQLGRNFMLTPYFGVGYHEWERDVGFLETYSHGYYGAGLMLQVSFADRFVITGTGLIGSTFGSEMEAGPSYGGQVPGHTYSLGDSTIYKFGVSGDYAITRNWHINAGVEWVDFEYGKSAVDNYGFLEPDSETSNIVVKAGIGYSFGPTYAEPLK